MTPSEQKHIVFVTPGFPANPEDTSCIPALQIYAKELSLQPDIKITIIATHYPYFSKQYNWNGIEIIAIGTKQNVFSKLNSFFKIKRILKKINKENRIDQIHCFWLNKVSFIANEFCLKNKIPLTITLMGQDVRLTNRSLKKINSVKANFITLSKFHDKTLKENVRNINTQIIYWGIEENVIENKTVPSSRDIDIISVGGFSEVKNLVDFIEIIEKIKSVKPEIKVIMVGGGILEGEIKKIINEKGLNNTIQITGMIPREEVLKIMQRFKILLHTSSFESFGMVLIEGLACGCKVISYPVGIAFEDRNIMTANTTNELVKLITNELGSTKFEHYYNYKISDTVNQYLNLYKSK